MNDMILKTIEGVEASVFDDGNENPSYLIGVNNRYWKVSEIIYYILCSIDGYRTISEIKEYLFDNYLVQIEEQKLEQIIDMAFVQNGIIEGTAATTIPLKNKILWGRFTLIKPNFIEKFKVFSFLFKKGWITTLSSVVVLWILYIIFTNSNSEIINNLFSLGIKEIILCYIYLLLAGLIHELGHSIATMSYGRAPGIIGAGVYIIMPVLFSDVTNVWNLKRQQRVVVDLGGMYLQGIFLVLSFLVNTFLIKSNLITIGILMSGFQIIGNLNPFIKFDGYWVLSDFLGVTEIRLVIGRVWIDLFRKLFNKPPKFDKLSKMKKVVIYTYSVFTACFFLNFFRFLVQALILAVQNVSSDILTVYELGPLGLHITTDGVVKYLSIRITTIIVLIFFIRIIWIYVIKKLFMRCKRVGK